MKKQTKVRLGFAALVLAASLGFMGVSPRDAFALPCCDQACGYIYENCLAGLAYPACGGDPGCCATKESICYSHCNPYC